jgi:type VI secretion system secreted protein VgrG
MSAPNSLILQCGEASITLKSDGTVEVKGAQKVAVDGGGSTVGLDGGGASMAGMKTTVAGSAVVEITGTLIKIN